VLLTLVAVQRLGWTVVQIRYLVRFDGLTDLFLVRSCECGINYIQDALRRWQSTGEVLILR
jgi:hypothetical protein